MGIYRFGPMHDAPRPEAGPVRRDPTAHLVPSGRAYPNPNADPDPNPHWSPANPDRDAIAHTDSGTYYTGGRFDRDRAGARGNSRLGRHRDSRMESDRATCDRANQLAWASMSKVVCKKR